MIKEETVRTAALLGGGACEILANSKVAVFGVGGVGGFVCEALARAGIGGIDLFDADTVALSNINRQIIALHSTVGRPKTEVMRERILDINPDCIVTPHQVFYSPENAAEFPLDGYDYVADAVDSVAAKVELALRAERAGVPIISAMGAGNKLDPEKFRVADITKTQVCPLARIMRKRLKEAGVAHLKVVYSEETVRTNNSEFIGSVSFVPSVAGLIMAGEIVRDLIG